VKTRLFVPAILALALVLGVLSPAGAQTAGRAAPAPAKPAKPGPTFPISEYGMRDDDNAVLRWNDTMLATIRLTAGAPPVNSRALAILNTAIYDAWAAYNPTARATQPNPSGLGEQPASPEEQIAAISHAAHAVLTTLPPYRTARDSTGAHPANVRLAEMRLVVGDTTAAARIGRGAAEAVMAARVGDGSNQANGYLDPTTDATRYTPRGSYASEATAFLWQPLPLPGQSETASPVERQKPALPHWRNVTTFGLPANWQYNRDYAAPGTAVNNGNGYKQEARDIAGYVANLNDERKACAVYWADGPGSETPPGHWSLIAQAVSRRDGNTLDEDVALFFAFGNAELNAGVVSWEAKYRFDFARPVTLIRWIYYYGAKKPDPAYRNWNSYIATPPFPEYTSGHSTFSAAAAQVLRNATGSDRMDLRAVVPAFTGANFLTPGKTPPQVDSTLNWPTFTDAVDGPDGSGVSRIYGGIHFDDANDHGQTTGTAAGQAAWDETRRFLTGAKGY